MSPSPLDPGYVDPVLARSIRRSGKFGRDLNAQIPGQAGPGFNPIDQTDQLLQPPLPNGAMQAPQSSGAAGQGTGQPPTPPSRARMDPQAMVGSAASPATPPTVGAQPPAPGPAIPATASPTPGRQAPPGVNYAAQMAPLAQRQAQLTTPVGTPMLDQAGKPIIDPQTGKPMQGQRPVLQSKGVPGALQRVALALLSATKLAPYAQQIVHPQFTQELASNAAQLQGIQDQLGTLKEASAAQEQQQRGAYYATQAEAMAEQGRLRPIALRDGSLYDPQTHQIINNPKTMKDRMQEYLDLNFDEPTARLLAAGMKPTEAGTQLEIDESKLPEPLRGIIKPDAQGRTMVTPKMLDDIMERLVPKTPSSATDQPLGADRVKQLRAALTQRWQVLHPGKPLLAAYNLADNATQRDYKNIDESLQQEESGYNARLNREAAAGARDVKQDAATKQASFKAYGPSLDSAERFNVMATNYENAIRNHDQQAMLSLLYNHMGMTMGLQKGARMTQALIGEAEKSRPWLQGMQAKFDKDGYLSGVTLTPEQMRQMVTLARERFSQDIVKSRSEAAYQGAMDEGPARVPNAATIRYYTALAAGDPNKAKQFAAEDGWSIK